MDTTEPAADLREVPRPSAAGPERDGIWPLVRLLAWTEFRRRYAQTALGYGWIFLGPLLYFGAIYLFVEEVIGRFIGEVEHFGALLLLNLVLYLFFRQAAGSAMRSLTTQGALVRKMPVPRVVLPAASVLAAAITLGFNLLLALGWLLADGIEPSWSWLLLGPLVAWLIVVTGVVALLLAGLHTGSRDIAQIWPTLARALLFISPIIYPLEVIPRAALWDLLSFNPLAPIFVQAHSWMVDPAAPGWFEAKGHGLAGLGPFVVLAVLAALAAWVFPRAARRVAEDL